MTPEARNALADELEAWPATGRGDGMDAGVVSRLMKRAAKALRALPLGAGNAPYVDPDFDKAGNRRYWADRAKREADPLYAAPIQSSPQVPCNGCPTPEFCSKQLHCEMEACLSPAPSDTRSLAVGMDWKLSDAAAKQIKEIDENRRNAFINSGNIIAGSGAPRSLAYREALAERFADACFDPPADDGASWPTVYQNMLSLAESLQPASGGETGRWQPATATARAKRECVRAAPSGSNSEIEAVGWAILQALHEGVEDAPQSWSDLAEDQEKRIKKAAVAAIEAVTDLSQYTAQGFSRALQPASGGETVEDVRWAVNVLLEKIAVKFEGWDTMGLWRSDAASTVRAFKHDLSTVTRPDRGQP